jgi:dTDP-4-dehydrorhamnose reductase
MIIEKINPNFVINCIGVLNQFAEENKSGAVLINSFFPHFIDSLAEKNGFKFIHISTDCVFSGEKGDYSETDFADAASFYGRTKSLGEVNNERSVTFRTSIVGPDINEKGIGLFNWFMKQEGETRGFTNVIWTGVTTLQLAKAIEKSFDLNVTGLYHLVNNGKISKYDLLLLFKKYMNKNIDIRKDESQVSKKTLINTRKDLDFCVPTYDDMVREMSEWIFGHEEKYKQIIINAKKITI